MPEYPGDIQADIQILIDKPVTAPIDLIFLSLSLSHCVESPLQTLPLFDSAAFTHVYFLPFFSGRARPTDLS